MNINLTLIGQALAFGIFIWFSARFIWPPLMKAIEERQKQIADGLAEAERGRSSLADAEKQTEVMIHEARARAQEILAQGEKRATEVVEIAKTNAKAEGDRLVAAAQAQIEQEVQSAKAKLREQVASLAVAGAEKILKREVDAKTHADMLGQLKAQL
jgi:F-type H+-transporting ATPase subunit b